MTFLTAAAGLADSTTSGPVRDQADQVLAMFGDADRCQVVLVTLAEETPVSETIETAYSLEDEVGIKLGPVVVNGLWPAIDGLGRCRGRRSWRKERRRTRGRQPPAVAAAAARPPAGQNRVAAGRGAERLSRRVAAATGPSSVPVPCPSSALTELNELATALLALRRAQLMPGGRPMAEAATPSEASTGMEPETQPSDRSGRSSRSCCAWAPAGSARRQRRRRSGWLMAKRGERVVVLTIDPARRLADALGLSGGLGNEAVRLSLPKTGRKADRRR